MKKVLLFLTTLVLTIAAQGQTLNIKVGSVTYSFPASQTGEMTYQDGTSLTIMGKTFTLTDISSMTVDTRTTIQDNTVTVRYDGTAAEVVVAGNVAQYVEPTVSGAHVKLTQNADVSEDNVGEITYTLSGTTDDGEFYLGGSFKATVELSGLTLTNTTPVYSGAAVHIQNGKRIKVKVVTGTVNTLTDAATGDQKGALYVKGHAEFAQKGTLNVTGRLKHAIKSGEYITLKNATLNVLGAAGDGISCNQFFLMESGTVSISGVADDGIQCDIDNDEGVSTGETTDHEDEDSGNIYLQGGSINVKVTADAAKGIKSEGDMVVSDGTITITTSGGGIWDSTKGKTKAAACLSADGNMTLSGGTLSLTSTGAGGKGISADGSLTISDKADITVVTKGNAVVASASGVLSTITNSQQLDNYTTSYKSSPKGIKADGVITFKGGITRVTTTGAGGEGIESKDSISITGGEIIVNAKDDAINAAYKKDDNKKWVSGSGNFVMSGGYLYACSTSNDGIDANGNCYINGGLVYAIGASSPEVAIDANSEEQKKLYVNGGTIIAIGGLERGSQLSQACYSSNSWSKNTWYAMTIGNEVIAFKTPASGGSSVVVSAASQPTLKSGVTASGTKIFDGVAYLDATVSGGSNVSLSNYNSNSGGGFGPGPHPGH